MNDQKPAMEKALQKKVQLVLHRKSTQAQAVYQALHGTAIPPGKAAIREVINLDQAATMLEQHGEAVGKWWANRLRRRCLKLKRCTIGFHEGFLEVEPFWKAERKHVRSSTIYAHDPGTERGPTEDPETGMPTRVVMKLYHGKAVLPNDPVYIVASSPELFQHNAMMRQGPKGKAKGMQMLACGLLKHLETQPDLVAWMIALNEEEKTGADQVLLKLLRERPEFAQLEKDIYRELPKLYGKLGPEKT